MIKRLTYNALLILMFVPCVFAASDKYITLKDGSVIKGELVSFENGTYTVETENLGKLELPEANVLSVATPGAVAQAPSAAVQPDFARNVSAMQNQIMTDPQAMQAVQAMAEDPEIASMISDPNFVHKLNTAVSNGNVDSVADDPRIQELMVNPKMQALIQQLQEEAPQQ